MGLAIVTAPNVVLATGGHGELYRDSVYPHKCFGSLGLALEEGLTLTNLTESQFGIGTPRSTFPWNLSGTYVQVIRISIPWMLRVTSITSSRITIAPPRAGFKHFP